MNTPDVNWDLCGLAFAPDTPKSLGISKVPTTDTYPKMPRRSTDADNLGPLELRVAHTERYAPSASAICHLREVYGEVGLEKIESFIGLGELVMINWLKC